MEAKKGANPELIVAVQMLSIGVILLILGLAVLFVSSPQSMAPFVRLAFLLSVGSIICVGLAFGLGGILRFKKARRA